MKYSAAAIFVAAASAAGVDKRSTIYEVSDFSAACIEHSVQCL